MVCTASATNVKRKLIVEFQDNIASTWTDWKDHRYIYAWYYDGSSDHDVTAAWDSKPELSWIADMSATSKAFYYDLEADETVFTNQKINIILINHNGDGTYTDNYNKIQISDIDFSEGDYFVTIYDDSGLKSKNGSTVQYYIDEYIDDSTDDVKTLMTYNNGLLSATYTSTSSSTPFVIAPSYALIDGNIGFWGLVYRTTKAEGNVVLNSFENYDGSAQNSTSGNVWDFSLDSKFDVTLDVFTKACSMHPYIERTLPLAAEGYATFSSEYSVTPDARLTSVRYASAVDGSGKITWSNYSDLEHPGILAGQGALLKGTAGATYKFTPVSTTPPSTPTTNLLKPVSSETKIDQTSTIESTTYNNYILTNKKDNGTTPGTDAPLGFYLVNSKGSWCKAGSAYLATPYSPSPARGYFPLWDEDTAVESIMAEIQDENSPVYDLQGRRVANPEKGLYIVNGKKVVIK